MTAQSRVEPPRLAKLREPFAANQVSKLPKPTKQQTEAVRADFKKGVRCKDCGSWHHPNVIHLDYVGHAALTDRLLDTDPEWSWEPLALTEVGLPAFDGTGGLWIKLTVLGVTRLGYGHAAAKPNADPGAREKEVIGDALRNAAMRFGAALDLWHKGDLHVDDDDNGPVDDAQFAQLQMLIEKSDTNTQAFCEHFKTPSVAELPKARFAEAVAALNHKLTLAAKKAPPKEEFGDIDSDSIPY